MRIIERLLAEIGIRSEEPFVMRSQVAALSKQLPLLYAILCTNAVALAFTHMAAAPRFLTAVIPSLLVLICAVRIVAWRRIRVAVLSDEELGRQLRRTMLLVVLLGMGFTAWSLSLFGYGDAYAKAHVAFFMSITVVGSIFCLIHLRAAALALTVIVTIPFTICFISSGEIVLIAIAINFLIVSVVMAFMLTSYYEDFRRLVHNTVDLAHLSEGNRHAADTDSLTGLANRRRFFGDIATAIEEHSQKGARFTLGLLDLDGFKLVNDIHGHQAGDEVLKEVGRRLLGAVGSHVTVARLGGDEFGLLVSHIDHTSSGSQAIGQGICEAVGIPIFLSGVHVRITASIGFAQFPAMGQTHDQLVEQADFALYHAKECCRGTAVAFTDEHAREVRARRQLEHELRHADLDAELAVVFQPMVDIAEDRLIGFEALARWTNGVLGPVSPGSFIPTAERIGVVSRMTTILFRKACEEARAWPSSVRLSFNLSVDDLMGDDASARLTSMVRGCGLPASQIIFEITETAIMRNFDHASATLSALRALGCRIALDDFGTGYSSLSYVNRLPLDKLKIDQSFVRSITTDRASRTIIASILDLSHNLGIDCVVEGVETVDQVETLRAIGCDAMQGYFFGRPMTPESARLRLATGAVRDAMAMAAA